MTLYKLIIAYDGTNYSGWQIQPHAQSIQRCIERALGTILQTSVRVIGAGRTDSGVHALAQCAHFIHPDAICCEKVLLSLNGLLPKDIRVLQLEAVEDSFHARYSAKRKIYHYHLHLEQPPDLFKRRFAYCPRFPIDIDLLERATHAFVGTHDFTTFSNRGGTHKSAVRTLHRLSVVEEPGGIRLEFEGNGFLYKMVRNIVGALLDICRGKLGVEEIPALFAAKDRRKGAQAAPPEGLFLAEIIY